MLLDLRYLSKFYNLNNLVAVPVAFLNFVQKQFRSLATVCPGLLPWMFSSRHLLTALCNSCTLITPWATSSEFDWCCSVNFVLLSSMRSPILFQLTSPLSSKLPCFFQLHSKKSLKALSSSTVSEPGGPVRISISVLFNFCSSTHSKSSGYHLNPKAPTS